ncbi:MULTISPECIES: DUF4241 domain-containing protein [unclassified Nostoc]|uniref:DUF4241 domain-containing protein n=1 Tax=unclassified Nostoc TaxID=2593658 RepID=UPI0025AA567A|nr:MULTISPECIES: DUF4241 domain-containing protein [unclassified Nostoc]MDM9581333.1 DUF4241 domain-containing protein [Nostoc sp. GT001]MDZ7948948.1 DUF4241 domain-containing protein [Nostoc sp. EfeVER01]MDZ7992460.1 DUF4241 domain-containing protein [Nostoc sp. EspVER01]
MINIDLSKAFQTGQRLNTRFGIFILNPYKIGKLNLTSGKLIACDPLVFPGTDPFSPNFKTGCYPVFLSIARNLNNEEPMVAYAMVQISEVTAVRWELATRVGEKLSDLKEGEGFFGYGVDSGIGCFMDADAAQIIINNTWETEIYEHTLACKLDNLLEEENSLGVMLANMCVNEFNKANVIAFATALGDGFYYTYFGYDTNNNVVNVITVSLSGYLQ